MSDVGFRSQVCASFNTSTLVFRHTVRDWRRCPKLCFLRHFSPTYKLALNFAILLATVFFFFNMDTVVQPAMLFSKRVRSSFSLVFHFLAFIVCSFRRLAVFSRDWYAISNCPYLAPVEWGGVLLQGRGEVMTLYLPEGAI